MNMKKAQQIFNFSVLAISAILLVGYVTLVDGPQKLLSVVSRVSPLFLICGIFCMVCYWALESACLHIAAKKLYQKQRLSDSVTVSMIGQLFNCITPFASGGQPVQAYQLMIRGMPIGLASSALLVKFIIYQTVLSVYSLVTLLFKFRFFEMHIHRFSILVFVGFIVNTFVVAGLAGICFFPKGIRKAAGYVIHFLSKLGLIKYPEKTQSNVECEIESFYQSFQILKKSPFLIVRMSTITLIQLTAFFAAPYFIGLSLGMAGVHFFTVICAGAFILMISSFVPLPGASGGAEGSFLVFFRLFFNGPALVSAALLLWRITTFYLPIVVGACFSLNNKNLHASLTDS